MKKSIVFIFVLMGFTLSAQNTKFEVLKQFVSGSINFKAESIDRAQPILSINAIAEEQADKTIDLTKENIAQALETARSYKACFITVGIYTIVKITNFDDCSPSGAWGVCMPMGKGYIQKAGVLNEKKDYIKNIIGRPGNQTRKLFLFK
ncbi:hypothetical protein [Ancylomarina longa]|uniref:Uncharacterized protein n=1 Tax=Ancylomarina longa TaxID=2487017 RepID=A0A434AW63_9BACT|nr:hypothetical protein [Ancylomarina longa]RUT78724.1 hypothetical protein DLK05_06175 [Ancylomarina longa]